MEEELKDMRWETLKSEYLIRRPWLTARRDTVRMPDGRINDEYYVLEYPTWVNVIAVTEEGDIVLVRQYRHGLGRTCFEIVAGVNEEGELPLEAAKRELLEETGYAGGRWTELMQLSANSSTTTNITHCFLAEGVKKVSAQHLDATEDIEIHVFKAAEVFDMLQRGEIVQALMTAPLWKYFYKRKVEN